MIKNSSPGNEPKKAASGPLKRMDRFVTDLRAATALEFALIGLAFFLFVFSIFVFSVDQFMQTTLDDAVRAATRQVQLGKIQSGPQFVAAVCNEFSVVATNCSNSLQYSVQGGPYFGAGGIVAANFNGSGNLSPNAGFSGITSSGAGTPQFLLVQVVYPLTLVVLMIPNGVATENGTSSLYSTVATELEP